jgi:asparagine synthetase B (glutamine-hydrolysing)
MFRGILELPPGPLSDSQGVSRFRPTLLGLDFAEDAGRRSEADYLEELESLLVDATQIRLRADVPVDWLFVRGRPSQAVDAIPADFKFVDQASLPQAA